MIGALLKTAGKTLLKFGKGMMKVGKGAFNFLGGRRLTRALRGIKDKLNPKNLIGNLKKKLGKYFPKFMKYKTPKSNPNLATSIKSPNNPSVFSEAFKMDLNKLSVADSNDELASEFHLSEQERKALFDYPKPSSVELDIDGEPEVEDVDYEDVTVDAVQNPIDPKLSYSTYIDDNGDISLSETTPEESSVIAEYMNATNPELVMHYLNDRMDQSDEVDLEDRKITLELLNKIANQINHNHYVFLDYQLSTRDQIYGLTKSNIVNQDVLKALSKYLLYKDGSSLEQALNNSNKRLIAILNMQQAQNSLLENAANSLTLAQKGIADTLTEMEDTAGDRAQGLLDAVQKTSDSSADNLEEAKDEIKDAASQGNGDIFDMIGGVKDFFMDQFKKNFEKIVLLLLVLDMLWSKLKEWFSNLSISNIAQTITDALKRWGINLWNIIRYWWKTVHLPGIKDSEGEFVWNGGDYYFVYNGKGNNGHDKGDVEKSNWTDSGQTEITRVYDKEGNLKSAAITSGEGKGESDRVGYVDDPLSSITVKSAKTPNGGTLECPVWNSFKDGQGTDDEKVDIEQLKSSHIMDKNFWDDMPTPTALYNPSTKLVEIQPNYRLYGGRDDKDKVRNWGRLYFKVDDGGNVILDHANADAREWFEGTTWDRGLMQHKRGKRVHRAIELIVRSLWNVGSSGGKNITQEQMNEKWGGNFTRNSKNEIQFSDNTGSQGQRYSQKAYWSSSNTDETDILKSISGGDPFKITSPYGWRIHPISKTRKFHQGVDLVMEKGTTEGHPLYAPFDASVVKVDKDYNATTGGGARVAFKTKDGKYMMRYMHLSNIDSDIKEGASIKKGDLIGRIGNSGGSTGPHLHLQVEKSPFDATQNSTIDPTTMTSVSDFIPVDLNGPQGDDTPTIENRVHNDYRNTKTNVCERSNNPGNLRGTSPKSQVRQYPGWVGITKSGSGDFSTFENQMWGIYAFYRLLATQYLPKGQNTIRTIFYKYCPPGDHGQGAPTAYIRSVSNDTGLGENEVIKEPTKDLFQSLMKAVYKFEGGTKKCPMAQEDLDEAWNIFSEHFKDKQWPVVATVEPQIYGTGGSTGSAGSMFSGGTVPARSYPMAKMDWEKSPELAERRSIEEFKIHGGEELAMNDVDIDLTQTNYQVPSTEHTIEVDPDYKATDSPKPLSGKEAKSKDKSSNPTNPQQPIINNNYSTVNAPKSPDQFRIDPDAFLGNNNKA